jgi:hypothetical protein
VYVSFLVGYVGVAGLGFPGLAGTKCNHNFLRRKSLERTFIPQFSGDIDKL